MTQNNAPIIRQWNGRIIRQRSDGYLSATDMCQATGKLFADWNRLKSTESLLGALSSDMGIPISHLIEIKKGNSSEFEQGAWLHPEVAVDLAQWLNIQLRIQVNRWIVELMTKGSISIAESLEKTPAQVAKEVIAETEVIVDWTIQSLGIDETIGKQMKLDMVSNQLPHLKASLEPIKKLIVASDPLESVGMNATQVGEHLSPVKNAKEVNELLESMGLQYKMYRASTKTGKQKWTWQVSDEGEKYSVVHKVTNSKTEWNGSQIKWQKSVVNLIQDFLT